MVPGIIQVYTTPNIKPLCTIFTLLYLHATSFNIHTLRNLIQNVVTYSIYFSQTQKFFVRNGNKILKYLY